MKPVVENALTIMNRPRRSMPGRSLNDDDAESDAAMTTAMAHSQMTIVLTSRSRKKSRRWPFQISTCRAKFTAPQIMMTIRKNSTGNEW